MIFVNFCCTELDAMLMKGVSIDGLDWCGADLLALSEKQRSPLKILLVEDNLVNQKVTLKQLRCLGYHADVALNGQEGIEAVAHNRYDIVLMDCQMPLVDGFDATRAIREMERQSPMCRPPLAVIAITTSTFVEDRERAIASGMDDYLSKPVGLEQLANTLNYWGQAILTSQMSHHSLDQKASDRCKNESAALPTSETLRPALDWDHLYKLSDGSAEFGLELLQIFLEDSQLHLQQLQAAIAAQNIKAVEHEAHYLKGSGGNVGAVVVQEVAAQLEQQARQSSLEFAEERFTALQKAVQEVKRLLEIELER